MDNSQYTDRMMELAPDVLAAVRHEDAGVALGAIMYVAAVMCTTSQAPDEASLEMFRKMLTAVRADQG
ncbi:hypothetical protein [Azorhizobium sp. AG788]|uniref:hypothetical protein n=1 Tax=Azorhizobium sp. AG788 TaxID=2183897 RepID=UPI0031394F3A